MSVCECVCVSEGERTKDYERSCRTTCTFYYFRSWTDYVLSILSRSYSVPFCLFVFLSFFIFCDLMLMTSVYKSNYHWVIHVDSHIQSFDLVVFPTLSKSSHWGEVICILPPLHTQSPTILLTLLISWSHTRNLHPEEWLIHQLQQIFQPTQCMS